MAHLQLILYVVLLSTGFGGITVAAIFFHRTGERVLLLMLIIISMFSFGLLLFLAMFYLEQIAAYPVDLTRLVGLANVVIVAVMYVGIALCVRWVNSASSPLSLALAATPVALAYLAFAFVAPAVPVLASWARANQGLVTLFSVGAASFFLGYAGWKLLQGEGELESASIRFLVRWLGGMLLAYAILSASITLLVVLLGASFDVTVVLNYLLFLGWNVVAIIAFIRYLTHPVDLLESGEVPDEARRRYGISAREVDVIVHLSRGLSNKEIADKLGVSFTTVRTHVYNIFKKTGAASRVELLRILSGR
ncbi:MAG TPA: helix-turn-helix transcriptional regulator [Spirochaetia bacterium]|nr:helix-turn-helix transcriptional regulator [Spirochaetia bacterium]